MKLAYALFAVSVALCSVACASPSDTSSSASADETVQPTNAGTISCTLSYETNPTNVATFASRQAGTLSATLTNLGNRPAFAQDDKFALQVAIDTIEEPGSSRQELVIILQNVGPDGAEIAKIGAAVPTQRGVDFTDIEAPIAPRTFPTADGKDQTFDHLLGNCRLD
jgi:hypothetical protein